MVKKLILASLCLVFCFMTSALAYDRYYNGNQNYEFAYIQMGAGIYIDKSSIESHRYTPPEYELSALAYSTDKFGTLHSPFMLRFKYDYASRLIYQCNPENGAISGHALRTDYNASEHDLRAVKAAIVIWNNAYELKW